jgi:phosphatidylserine/phosphatidylglycerophosphate/cardiolipin synthase-like enzyme
VFRRRVLVPFAARLALAVLAAALAVAGCKPLKVPGPGGQGHGHGSGGAPASAQSGPLFTEPSAGFSAVYRLIGHARHSIDMTMFEFADTKAEHGLAAAARRGVRVKVVLDQREQSTNSAAYRYLGEHGVKVTWSSPHYEYTHQKTIVVDGHTALIMTANLTSQYYPTSRDFLIEDTKHADVSAIVKVFQADFAHRPVTPGDGRDLVWSPTSAQGRLLALINGARRSLRIYSEEMGDSTIEDALIKAAHRGVNVRVCGEDSGGEYDDDFARLSRAGVRISYYSSSHGFYIHGKVVEADYGTQHAKVFIGSENFSSTSLNRNRELGLITSDQQVMSSIAKTFAADFRNGKHWS